MTTRDNMFSETAYLKVKLAVANAMCELSVEERTQFGEVGSEPKVELEHWDEDFYLVLYGGRPLTKVEKSWIHNDDCTDPPVLVQIPEFETVEDLFDC
jgi:hypothetical protein